MIREWRNRHIPWQIRRNRYATADRSVWLRCQGPDDSVNACRFRDLDDVVALEATIERGRCDGDDDHGRQCPFKDLGRFAAVALTIEHVKIRTIGSIDENA